MSVPTDEHSLAELPATDPTARVLLALPRAGRPGPAGHTDDLQVRGAFSSIGDPTVDAQVRAECAMLARLHGGCSMPVGAAAHYPTAG